MIVGDRVIGLGHHGEVVSVSSNRVFGSLVVCCTVAWDDGVTTTCRAFKLQLETPRRA